MYVPDALAKWSILLISYFIFEHMGLYEVSKLSNLCTNKLWRLEIPISALA